MPRKTSATGFAAGRRSVAQDQRRRPSASSPGFADRHQRRPAAGAPDGLAVPARGRCDGARARVAGEAARIMAEQGVVEFERARRKAALRVGVADRRCWPDNAEIEAALQSHYRLFDTGRQRRVTALLLAQALQAMRLLAAFEPRLVGAALTGIATREQGVALQVFADDPSAVLLRLLDCGIRFEEHDRPQRYSGGVVQTHPAVGFIAGEVPVEVLILPLAARRHPPLSPVTDRPERGLDAAGVARRLEELPADA